MRRMGLLRRVGALRIRVLLGFRSRLGLALALVSVLVLGAVAEGLEAVGDDWVRARESESLSEERSGREMKDLDESSSVAWGWVWEGS